MAASRDLYQAYCHFYDEAQGASDASPYLELLWSHHPKATSVLELGCGAGSVLKTLSEHYEVTGLDPSPSMLRRARKRVPNIKFVCADMAGFSLAEKFDAVIIPFESINHLLSFDLWLRTFDCVRDHLENEGVLVFDANTPYGLDQLAEADPGVLTVGEKFILINVKKPAGDIVDWDIRVFERRSGSVDYRMNHDVIQEVAFPHDRVMRALQERFSAVHAYDGNGRKRPHRASRKLYYACHHRV